MAGASFAEDDVFVSLPEAHLTAYKRFHEASFHH
jgi:hypothetical protein